MNTLSAFAAVAQRLIERGYSCVPILPGSKSPGHLRRGEWRPMSDWPQYANRLPSRFEIEVWRTYRDAGIGVVSGPASHHLVGIDLDTDNATIRGVFLSVLPPATVIKRGSKGETRFFRGPNIGRSKSWKLRGNEQIADLIGPGRQTVLPPSVHPGTGQPYRWIGPEALEDSEPGELPELTPEHVAAIDEALRPFGYAVPLPQPERNPSVFVCSDTRFREYALGVLRGCAAELAQAQPRTRNPMLNAIAYKLGRCSARGWLNEDEVGAALWAACIDNGLIADDGDRRTYATFRSGFSNGLKRPAPDPPERLKPDPAFAARIKLKPRAA